MRGHVTLAVLVSMTALHVVAVPARAQNRGNGLTASALGYRAKQRSRYLGAVQEQSGMWLGAEGVARVGWLALRVSGVMGSLAGDSSSVEHDRDVRVSTASLSLRPAPWLDFGADVVARRVEFTASTVVTRLVGGHLALGIPLGVDGLVGTAVAAYYPATDVTGDEKISLALAGELGFRYQAPGGGVAFQLSYRVERYDYGATALRPARLEQTRGLMAGLGIQFGQ